MFFELSLYHFVKVISFILIYFVILFGNIQILICIDVSVAFHYEKWIQYFHL